VTGVRVDVAGAVGQAGAVPVEQRQELHLGGGAVDPRAHAADVLPLLHVVGLRTARVLAGADDRDRRGGVDVHGTIGELRAESGEPGQERVARGLPPAGVAAHDAVPQHAVRPGGVPMSGPADQLDRSLGVDVDRAVGEPGPFSATIARNAACACSGVLRLATRGHRPKPAWGGS
jgi:hypothetical protein